MQSPFASIQGIGGLNSANAMTNVNSTAAMSPISNTNSVSTVAAPTENDAKSFSNLLGDALSGVNSTMQTAANCTNGLLDGSMENLHDMSIAGAKSEVMLHLTTQIASKLCSSATTLFQMQL